jgi:uncharacterized membrane protein YcaP (DUF421 family)
MPVDWSQVFVPSGSLLEIIVRGSVIYLCVFAFMRVMRRDAGHLSRADLLFVTLVSDAAQNGMAGEYRSVTEGLVLIGTILGWNFGLDWLAFHLPFVRRLLEPAPLLLIRDGRLLRRNMRAELVTREELFAHLREAGLEGPAQVKRCYVESEGQFTVIRADA